MNILIVPFLVLIFDGVMWGLLKLERRGPSALKWLIVGWHGVAVYAVIRTMGVVS